MKEAGSCVGCSALGNDFLFVFHWMRWKCRTQNDTTILHMEPSRTSAFVYCNNVTLPSFRWYHPSPSHPDITPLYDAQTEKWNNSRNQTQEHSCRHSSFALLYSSTSTASSDKHKMRRNDCCYNPHWAKSVRVSASDSWWKEGRRSE